MPSYWQPDGKPTRRPSMRGVVMLDVVNGVPRVRLWPRKRGKSKTPGEIERTEFFRHASWAAKYLEPSITAEIMAGREGTAFLPRDIAFMMFAGTLAYIVTPNGKVTYPVQAMQKVSESLDALSQIPGMMLVRGSQFWEAIPIPSGLTETSWIELTFSTSGATKWNGLTWFQADQQFTAQPGQTIEFDVKFKHYAGAASALALSHDGEKALAAYHWTDGQQYLGRHDTAGGAYIDLAGPQDDFDGNLLETIRLSSTVSVPSTGLPNHVYQDHGYGTRCSAAANVGAFNLNGLMAPFWLSSPNGLSDIELARYRIVGL